VKTKQREKKLKLKGDLNKLVQAAMSKPKKKTPKKGVS